MSKAKKEKKKLLADLRYYTDLIKQKDWRAAEYYANQTEEFRLWAGVMHATSQGIMQAWKEMDALAKKVIDGDAKAGREFLKKAVELDDDFLDEQQKKLAVKELDLSHLAGALIELSKKLPQYTIKEIYYLAAEAMKKKN